MATEQVETAVYRLRVEGEEEIDRLTKSIGDLTVAEEKATTQNRTTSDELQKRLARYDPLIRAQQAYSAELQKIARYQETGVGTQQQINALFEGATTRYQAAQKAAQGLGEAHQGMSTQAQSAYHSMRSFFEQIAMGASPMQAAIAQMNHMAYAASGEGGIVGAFKQAGEMATSFLTPVRLAIGAVAALAAGVVALRFQWSAAQRESQLAITGIGGASGTSVGDINRFASTQSSYGGLTTGEARNAAIELAKTGQIAIATLHGVGDAIHGFAILTNTDATAATKTLAQALSGDLVKGMDDLNKATGDFSTKDREFIQSLQAAGKETEARQFMIDKMSESLRKAAEQTGFWSDQWNRFKQAVSSAGENLGKALSGGDLEERLAKTKAALDELEKSGRTDVFANEIDNLRKKVAELNAELEKNAADSYAKKLNILGTEAQGVTEKLIPEIAQLRQAELEFAKFKAAQEAGIQLTPIQEAAKQKLDDYIAKLKEATTATAVLATETANTSAKNVAALGDAATSAEKAQARIDALTASFQNGQISADVYARAVAGVTAQLGAMGAAGPTGMPAGALQAASTQLATITDQNKQFTASGKDVVNTLGDTGQALKDVGVNGKVLYDTMNEVDDSTKNLSKSTQQLGDDDYHTAQKNKQFAEELKQHEAYLVANKIATDAWRQSLFALGDAMNAGASAFLSMGAASRGWVADQQYMATSFASRAAGEPGSFVGSGGGGSALVGGFNNPFFAAQQLAQISNTTKSFSEQVAAAGAGGVQAALNFAMGQQAHAATMSEAGGVLPGGGIMGTGTFYQTGQAVKEEDIVSQVTSLYQTLNQQNPAAQAANMQAEMAWLQSRPTSIAQQQAIAQLQQSIQDLTKSTDQLNATNQELLSPYYTLDPRTSHIGFRSQGMATGGWVDVPGGYSANDNMIASIPVASGERIFVDPMGSRRTATGPGHTTINISQPIMIAGNADKDQLGRTLFQSNQGLAKQINAATAR
jgi:tail length tape measure protein